MFSCDIYAAENTGLLAKICACLKARVMLQEDKDYILRDGAAEPLRDACSPATYRRRSRRSTV